MSGLVRADSRLCGGLGASLAFAFGFWVIAGVGTLVAMVVKAVIDGAVRILRLFGVI